MYRYPFEIYFIYLKNSKRSSKYHLRFLLMATKNRICLIAIILPSFFVNKGANTFESKIFENYFLKILSMRQCD